MKLKKKYIKNMRQASKDLYFIYYDQLQTSKISQDVVLV